MIFNTVCIHIIPNAVFVDQRRHSIARLVIALSEEGSTREKYNINDFSVHLVPKRVSTDHTDRGRQWTTNLRNFAALKLY